MILLLQKMQYSNGIHSPFEYYKRNLVLNWAYSTRRYKLHLFLQNFNDNYLYAVIFNKGVYIQKMTISFGSNTNTIYIFT